ncbi:hypothetical protein K501DRAFT_264617 [Backusella circina FSU 941]|nr:hypothetical protein K501DRAFT_264617 [Backusella circina FSU 941]
MCYRTTCSSCQKQTWAGCGMHIETALAGVPKEQICVCPRPEGVIARIKTALGF